MTDLEYLRARGCADSDHAKRLIAEYRTNMPQVDAYAYTCGVLGAELRRAMHIIDALLEELEDNAVPMEIKS